MLLDDVLSELDPDRRARLLQTLAGPGQTLISTADARTVPDDVEVGARAGAAAADPATSSDAAAEIA